MRTSAAPSSIASVPGGLVNLVTEAYQSDDAVTTKTEYHTSFPHAGLPGVIYSAWGTNLQTDVSFTYDSYRNPWYFYDELDPPRITITQYNALNQLETTTEPDPDGVGDKISPVTKFRYDALGRLEQKIDARGNTTMYTYDGMNRLRKIIPPAPGNEAGHEEETESNAVVEYQYDPNGNLRREIVHVDGNPDSVDANSDRVTTRDYDARNLLQMVTYADTSASPLPDPFPGTNPVSVSVESLKVPVIEYRYDALGNPRFETDPRNIATSEGKLKTKYIYDELGRLIEVIHPESHDAWATMDGHTFASTNYDYDAVGRLTAVRTPRGTGGAITQVTTNYEYDNLDRLWHEYLPPDSHGVRLTTTREYDLRDNLVTETVTGGDTSRVTQNYYDKQNRLIAVDHPDLSDSQPGVSTLYAYAADGSLLRELTKADNINVVTDLLGFAGSYYTTVANLEAINLSLQAPPNKVLFTQYTNNNLGRPTGVIGPDPDGSGPLGPVTVSYGYDEASNVIETIQAFVDAGEAKTLITNTEYDTLNRPWRVQGPADAQGRRAETKTAYAPDGNVGRILQSNVDSAGSGYWQENVLLD